MEKLNKLLKGFDPLDNGIVLANKEMVDYALSKNAFYNQKIHRDDLKIPYSHAKRVAYFIEAGWQDPIVIDIQKVNDELVWYMDIYRDNMHKYAAAMYRKDKTIELSFLGNEEDIYEFIGIN